MLLFLNSIHIINMMQLDKLKLEEKRRKGEKEANTQGKNNY